MIAVHVDGVVGHRQVADADAHPFTTPHRQRIDARENSAVESPQIEVRHGQDLGT